MRYTLQILEIEMNNSDYGITLSQRHAPSVMFRREKKQTNVLHDVKWKIFVNENDVNLHN